MTDRPIIFSGPMVRAILEGHKTQTRRVCKLQAFAYVPQYGLYPPSPYGVPGDRLWVRETFMATLGGIVFAADGGDHYGAGGKLKWKPSLFMPRWASRLTLEIVNVCVERLQEISEDDAFAEGVNTGDWLGDPVGEYAKLWDSINAKRAPWASNPWVWVVEFRKAAK